ncbi:MAG: ABC transporter substrate-binding protein [Clostridia bacterium]|nr:ABC transporter substrate-binding protein [Clostridia bacterium]
MKKRIISAILAAIMIMLMLPALSGCGDSGEYPVTVAGVSIEERPEKIVCLSVPYTQIIVDMGYTDLLAGRSAECELAEVQALPSCGTAEKPSLEVIAEMGADLLIVDTASPTETLTQINELGITVLQLVPPTSRTAFSNLYRCIGTAMNGAETGYIDGDNAAKKILIQLDDVERAVMSETPMNVCIFTNAGLSGCITGDDLASMLIELAGGFNIAIEATDGFLDLESIALSDPDVILCPPGCESEVRSKRDLEGCSALTNNRIFAYDTSKFDSYGYELVLATWELARLIHPNVIDPSMLPNGAVDYYPTYENSVMTGEEYEEYLEQMNAALEESEDVEGGEDGE